MIQNRAVIRVCVESRGLYRKAVKRVLDFVASLIAIVVLAPIILVIAGLVRLRLGSPVIFKQERPGLGERIFTIYKFRTMTDERDDSGELSPDELRLTRFGRFLRSTSLDELPELFNVLKGDMSIVGPRPLLVRYLPYYKEEERLRHTVRPGLTGLAQVSGRNVLEWDKRLQLDVEYVRKLSFWLDLYIVILTIKNVILRKDIRMGAEHTINSLDVERELSGNGNS